MREYEEVARRLISKVLGVSVIQHDYNIGYSIPDLRIEYSPSVSAYVEVVSDYTQKDWRALKQKLEDGNREDAMPGLRYDWWIAPKVKTQTKKLIPGLRTLLDRLEGAGETFDCLVGPELKRRIKASRFYDEINRLGIEYLVAGREAVDTAIVRYILPGADGPAEVDMDRLATWCGEFLSAAELGDVRRKLAATKVAERHAFVVVNMLTEWDVRNALSDDARGKLPEEPPQLPEEVTHVWLLGTDGLDRCVAWLPDRGGWIDYECGPWHED